MANEVPTLELRAVQGQGRGTLKITATLGGQSLFTDEVRIAKAAERERFIDSVKKDCPGIDRAALVVEMERLAANETKRSEAPALAEEPKDAESLLAAMPEEVRNEARTMLESSQLMQQIVDDIQSIGVAGERVLAATIYMIGTSRLLSKPLAGIVQGPSSSGKSFTYERVGSMFPPEAVIHAAQMTPQALFHMKPGSLVNKWVIAGERSRLENDDAAEATRALREMLSAGRLTKLMPVKDGNKIVTEQLEQDGPIAFIESTTLAKIFDEDANRCILLQTDEQEAQTRRIIECMAAASSGARKCVDVERIIQRHHAMQRMLKPAPVVIPFAEHLAKRFPTNRVEVRRAFGHVLSMVQTSAVLHQYQRQRDDDGRIVAAVGDYKLTAYLLDSSMSRLLGRRVSDAALRFYERLSQVFGASEHFNTKDAAKREPTSDRAVRGWLLELHEAGFIDLIEPGRGPKPSTWKLSDDPPSDEGIAALPNAESLGWSLPAFQQGANHCKCTS